MKTARPHRRQEMGDPRAIGRSRLETDCSSTEYHGTMARTTHPLLDDFRQFNAEAARRYPADFDEGLGQMGMLIYPECRREGSWCTPKNSTAFATTGGNGVHFSFIAEDDKITEDSPVIVTVPANPGRPEDANLVVGHDLRDFLSFGLHRGYFALEQLAYYRDLTLQVYSTPEWEPTEKWHDRVGYVLSENGKRVRDYLIERFGLTPLSYTVAEFEALQEKYKPLLDYMREEEW